MWEPHKEKEKGKKLPRHGRLSFLPDRIDSMPINNDNQSQMIMRFDINQ